MGSTPSDSASEPPHRGSRPEQSPRPSQFFLNADFDLSLRPRWHGGGPAERRFIAELSQQFLLAGGPDDSLLLHEPYPEEHLCYLEQHGFDPPRRCLLPAISSELQFAPYGWSSSAMELNRRYRQPSVHPPLAVIELVNSRRFSCELEQRLIADNPVAGTVRSLSQLQDLLAAQPAREHGWVVKSDHGNAGSGNRRLRSHHLDATDRRIISSWLEQDDWLVLERWQPRLTDLCTTFGVTPGGEAEQILVHEQVLTADGGFIGALFDRGSGAAAPRRDELYRTARQLAQQLAAAGYHGPVCVDSYLWHDGEGVHLRPLVDLNARLHMSLPALRLWRRWQGEVTVYWRFFSGRKLKLPSGYDELCQTLGRDAFDPGHRRGLLLTSPLRLWRDSTWQRPAKIGTLLVADDRDQALALERRFRQTFER